jgi:hypothetical protein
MNRPILLLLAVAALASGCRKPMPSPDYIEASNRYTNLLAVEGDDAYGSDAMDEVVSQLTRVSPKSSDHTAAVALIATISSERARLLAEASKPPPAAAAEPVFPSFAPVAKAEEPEVVEEVADAAVNELARGADFAFLQRKYVGCLVSRGLIAMVSPDGGIADTEGFELHDSASCRSRLAGIGPNVLVVQAGKVAYVLPKSSFKTVETLADGGTLPAP